MFADKTLTIPEHVMSRQVGEETVILDLGSGTYFGLDAVGARIWQLLSTGTSIEQIVVTMMGEYDVEQENLQQDVHSLVSELIARGLVHAG